MPRQAYAVKKNLLLPAILIYACLVAGVGTYFLPVIRVNLPPLGEKSWSVQDIVGPIVQRVTFQRGKSGSVKMNRDFLEIVNKVSTQNSKTSAPQKISLTYIFGALVPIALLASYVFLIASFILTAFNQTKPLLFSTATAAVTAIYALLGTFYLGSAAERAFANAVSKASEGMLGVITKNFEVKLTVQPSIGLFLLAILMTLGFAASLFRNNE